MPAYPPAIKPAAREKQAIRNTQRFFIALSRLIVAVGVCGLAWSPSGTNRFMMSASTAACAPSSGKRS
jgi:hypothetical protein